LVGCQALIWLLTKKQVRSFLLGKLILVRHGHTCLNIPGREERLRGWLDLPLDQQGLDEAAQTAERLAKYPVDAIFSSDLRRARQTAEVLRRRVKARRVSATPDLRPWNLGVFCGERVRDILPFLNLLNQQPSIAAPRGESFYQFYGRYSHRLTELLSLTLRTSGSIVAVTHVRNVLATKTIIEQGNPDHIPVKGGPPTGTLLILERQNGTWQMRLDDGHAQPELPFVALPSIPTEACA
jgi:broad specificity phosphatase PhoE